MLSWCKTYLKICHCRKYLLNALDKINTKKIKSQFVIIEILEKKKQKQIVDRWNKRKNAKRANCVFCVYISTGFLATALGFLRRLSYISYFIYYDVP